MRGERRKSTSLAFEGTKLGQTLLPNELLLPESVSFVCYQPIPNTSSFSNLTDQCLQERFPSSPMVPILIADECACLATVDLSGMKPRQVEGKRGHLSECCLIRKRTTLWVRCIVSVDAITLVFEARELHLGGRVPLRDWSFSSISTRCSS